MTDGWLDFWRDAELDEHKHVQGYLWVRSGVYGGPGGFWTREKGQKFVRMRPGTYTMEHSTLSQYPDVKCLRPVGLSDPKQAACLIHPITDHVNVKYRDSAEVLAGCIAPFLMWLPEAPGSSKAAMEMLWKWLGGYAKGKQVSLRIINDVPASAQG